MACPTYPEERYRYRDRTTEHGVPESNFRLHGLILCRCPVVFLGCNAVDDRDERRGDEVTDQDSNKDGVHRPASG